MGKDVKRIRALNMPVEFPQAAKTAMCFNIEVSQLAILEKESKTLAKKQVSKKKL